MVILALRKAMYGGLAEKIIGIRSGLPGMVYSHSELFFYPQGKAYVVAASGVGWKTRKYDHQWDLVMLPLDAEEEATAKQLCDDIDAQNPKYDWPGLFHIGLLHLAGKQLPKWWFCSEHCTWVLKSLGYLDLFVLEPESYTPALLAYTVKQWKLLPESIQRELKARAKAYRGAK